MKKRYKIPLAFISFLLLACLVFWFILTQTKFLENQVNRSLRVFLETRYPIKVKIGDIGGSFWNNLIIKDLTIDFTQEGQEYRMASIPYLKVDYRLSNIWRKKWILDSLRIEHPQMTIKTTKEGQLLFPLPKAKGIVSKTGLFNFKIGYLKIEEGSLEYISQKSQTVLDSLNLELSLSRDKEGTKIEILQGSLVYPQKELLVKNLAGSFLMEEDDLFIRSLKVQTGESRFEITGNVQNIKDPQFSFSVKADSINLAEIKKLSGVGLEGQLKAEGTCIGNSKRFEGKATVDGKFFERKFDGVKLSYVYQNKKILFPSVAGKIFDSPLNGGGELDFSKKPEEYNFEGRVANLDLNNVLFNTFHTDLTGDISMKGKALSEKNLILEMGVNLGKGRFDQYTFSAVKGDLTVTSSAVTFHPGFEWDYKHTQVVLSGDLQYEGEVNIEAEVNLDDLKDFENQIFIEETAGKGKANLKISGKTSDFDVQGRFFSDSCYLYQLYSSNVKTEFQVANFLTRRKGAFDLSFLNGLAWSIPYDSLTSRIQIDGDWVTIDSTSLENEYMNVGFWGTLDISKTPEPLRLDKVVLNFRGNHIESFSPVELSLDSLKVQIDKAIFSCLETLPKVGEGGKIEASGIIDFEERMNLSLNLSGIDIVPWINLLTKEKIEGELSLQAKVDGNFTEPEIELDGKIGELKFEGIDLGQLNMSLSYKDKRLEFKQFDITGNHGIYALSGFIPLNLSFSSVDKRFLEEPQNLSLKVKRERIDLVRVFIPEIEYLKGPFEGDLKISGEFLHPQFDGKFNLKNGTLKFVELSDPVKELEIEMKMENENLILDKVKGFMEHEKKEGGNLFKKFWRIFSPKQNVRGEINGSGTINIKDLNQPDYELYFVGKDIPINYEYADLSAVADFSLAITGKTPPLLSAQIDFSQLYYREPFASSGSGTSLVSNSGEQGLWDWNLDVSTVSNCWVINDDVNLEFKGNVLVLRENGELRILGNLETIRGKYFLYGTKFEIEKGNFVFDDIEKIDPKIDFLVSTNLGGGPSTSSEGLSLLSTGSTNQIELAIKGTISAPEVEPASGSSYSKEDLIELLAFQQSFGSVDTQGVGSLFQERVIKSLGGAYSSRFLENIAGRSLGVETFEITPAWSDKFRLLDAEITVGKYISDKIYLRYTRRLSQSSGQETGVEYRLNRNLLLEGRKDKSGLFHLGLNLNWEY
jgi:autotransporter translocation and assembly factor TamB